MTPQAYLKNKLCGKLKLNLWKMKLMENLFMWKIKVVGFAALTYILRTFWVIKKKNF